MSKTGRYDDDLERVFREEHGRVVATLVRHFGDIDVAEEQKIKANRIPYRVPADAELPDRLRSVLPAAGLAIVNELALTAYHPFHAARADLLRREGRTTEAVEAYTLAIDLSTNPAEKSYLRARRQDLQPR